MKKLIVSFVVTFLFSGCANFRIPYTHEEICALEGMRLFGVDLQNSKTIKNLYQDESDRQLVGQSLAYSSDAETVSCRQPETAKQTCEINFLISELAPKAQYNEGHSSWLDGGDGKGSAIRKSKEIAASNRTMCDKFK